MIEDADRYALAYVEAGCGSVTFHVEAATAPVRLAREIRRPGARASMALKPATPIEPYEDLLAELGHGADHDRRARLRRPVVPRPVPAQDPARPRADGQARPRDLAAGRRRRLAGHRSSAAPRPAPTCSSPAPPSTPPTTPTRWSPSSAPPPRQPGPEGAAPQGLRASHRTGTPRTCQVSRRPRGSGIPGRPGIPRVTDVMARSAAGVAGLTRRVFSSRALGSV